MVLVRVSLILAVVLGALFVPGSADASGGVQFTHPLAGDHVRGTTRVAVTADPSTTSVLFEWSSDGTTWTTIGTDADGGDGWSSSFDTTSASDGPVTLRATAATSGGPVAATEGVVVDNTAPNVGVVVVPRWFSPNGDGRKDVAHACVTLSESASMTVRVVNANGVVVRTLASGASAPKGTSSFTWNGNAGGHRAADGRYGIVARAVDEAGNHGTDTGPVRLDTKAPLIRWISVRPEPASRSPVTATFGLQDASGIAAASVALVDEVGVVRRVRITNPRTGPSSVRVPIRYANGSLVMPALYRLGLMATDRAGNMRTSKERSFRVVRPVTSKLWYNVEGAGRHVSLTFDDCNDGSAWNRILNVLTANHLHATFFCIGGNVERYADTARRTIRLGDSVGNHTWDHQSLPGHSLSFVENELEKDANAWWKVARVTPLPYFRPPYGAHDRTTIEAAGRLGYSRTMLWDVDPQDWRRPGARVIASKVLGAIHPGAIVVLHVQAQTAAALPAILSGLRSKHLLQSSLPELFGAAGMR